MKYSFTLVLLIILSVPAFAQYITMANSYSKPEQHVQTGRPLKTIEIYRSRLFGKKYILRKEIDFNWSAMQSNYRVYKKDILVHQVETCLDPSLLKVLSIVNINNEPKRVFSDSFWFSYDANGTLIRMVSSFNGKLSTTLLKVDSGGFTTKAQVNNAQGEIIALEKATYHPEENYYVIFRKANRNDERIIQDTQRIDQYKYSSVMDEKMLFNEQGDMTLHKLKNKNNRAGAEYQNEYEYDDRGNWIKKRAYIIDRKTGKRKLISRSEREIVYGD